MAEFTWIPSYASSVEDQPRVKSLEFGDGYMQRDVDGIHTSRERWSLLFNKRTDDEKLAIRNFLKDNLGQSFDWVPPGEVVPPESSPRKFICPDPVRSEFLSYNSHNLSMTFLEVFE